MVAPHLKRLIMFWGEFMSSDLKDMLEGYSNCCGAKVYLGVCSDCQEHCSIMEEDEDPKEPWTDRPEYDENGMPSE